jgi:3-phytase
LNSKKCKIILTICLLPLTFCLSSCSENTATTSSKAVIEEVFQTSPLPEYNIDSPAIWHGPDNQNWIIATAKEGNCLVIYDAQTGDSLGLFGTSGNEAGQFLRPNGIFVLNNTLFVVERDNHRVQMLSLPDFRTISFIGSSSLKRPYGIYAFKDQQNYFHVYVTDNFENIDSADDLSKRIHYFSGKDSIWQLVSTFGETSGSGKLAVVESILGDPESNLLYLAEEDTTQSTIKIYDFDGTFTGKIFGMGIFKYQVEGLALYRCENGRGMLIATDQSHDDNQFHVFDRTSLEHIGTFSGAKTANTDGIWLTQHKMDRFSKGAFYAIHDDQAVSAFDFKMILQGLGAKLICP